MTEEEKFDAIIVGAGPAGCATAYSLAKMGFNVLMIDRGRYAGAKNMMGGRMYSCALRRLIPEFWKEAPVERIVTQENWSIQSGNSSLTFSFRDEKLLEPPNSFTILRAKFDQWFANKAAEAGAVLVSGIKVDDILRKNGQVAGIIAGSDQIAANVVIAADGAVSLIAEKAGLRKFEPEEFAVGIKEVIELPEKTIEERFNLSEKEGVAHLFIGCTEGIPGGGFVYTNRASLSIGIVVYLDQLIKNGKEVFDIFCDFKKSSLVSKLIRDGKETEYSAHVIPEGSRAGLFTDGLLAVGDAAGLTFNNGFTVRGMDMAIASGMAAAKAVKITSEKNDFSKESLSCYEQLLKNDPVLKDLKTFEKAPEFLRNERLHSLYPKLACDLFCNVSVVNEPKKKLFQEILETTKGRKIAMFKDLIRGMRSL